MNRSSPTTGSVQNDMLIYQQDGYQVTAVVDTPAWHAWLEGATSFSFKSVEGSFTAQKLRASNGRGNWYWYAYRRQEGHLSNFYLGTSAKLTLLRLQEAARSLAQAASKQKSPLSAGAIAQSTRPTNTLLLSKLRVPRLTSQHVSRPRLLRLLDEGAQRSLTLISAPAGSGKTTLLAEWASMTTAPLAWISLETMDNDPARFLSYLLAALAPLVGRQTPFPQPPSAHSPEHALTNILNELTGELQQETVLILDDYHLLTSETVHALLRFLLDHLPERLHLMMGTRVDPQLPLPLLRARSQLSEIRTRELRFQAEEVAMLTQAMGLALSSTATQMLEQQAEGWITGIQLLALALQGQKDTLAFLQASRGTPRFLLDYVSEEVLAQQEPELQTFLLHTCILRRMCGSLCEAVTEQAGGQERLAGLLRANLFVSTLDDTETWYSYHPLFAEALRAHLQKLKPGLLPELSLRASLWYEQQQDLEESCDYALLAGDFARAARLLAEMLPSLIEQGHFMQLTRWLKQLPPSLIAASPQLYIAAPWLSSFSHRLPEQRELELQHMQRHVEKQQQEEGSSWTEAKSVLTVIQATNAMSHDNNAGAFQMIRQALQLLTTRDTALSQLLSRFLHIALSMMYGESGDLASAEQILLDLSITQPEKPFSVINLVIPLLLSELYRAQGRLRKAELLYKRNSELFDTSTDMPPIPLLIMSATWMRQSALLYEWNRLTEAMAITQRVLEILPRTVLDTFPAASRPSLLAFGLWTRARIEQAQGHPETAHYFLEMVRNQPEMTDTYGKEKPPVDVSVLAARLALSCGLLDEASKWADTCDVRFHDTPDTLLESRQVFAYLTLARVLIACGQQQHNETALSQASTLLKHWQQLAERLAFQGWLIEIQMLTALALQAQGQIPQALTELGKALDRAEAEGYIRLFADEGEPMAALLAQVSAFTSASSSYLQRLQSACRASQRLLPPSASATPPLQTLLDPLSRRELEVLALLAAGSSNQQIADALVISLHTAKRHVKNILAKLEASNRTQAVARARELYLA